MNETNIEREEGNNWERNSGIVLKEETRHECGERRKQIRNRTNEDRLKRKTRRRK
jgi:hypothetical protein